MLIGSAGQLGQELAQTLPSLGHVMRLNRQSLDIIQSEAIYRVVTDAQPDVIVNAAAYTAVDQAESEPDLAYQVNALAPGTIAKAAQKVGALLVHISTDYVFDGKANRPYRETDQPNPSGVYGMTKLAGEQAIQQNCDRYIILRTAWVYGTYGTGNFVKTMLKLAAQQEQLNVVDDQIGTPTWAHDTAQATTALIDHWQSVPASISGQEVYHFTNSGVASWYDFAIAIIEAAQELGFPVQVQQINPIPTEAYPTLAKRPPFSALNHRKIQTILGAPPPHWRHSLRRMLHQYREIKLLASASIDFKENQ